MGKTTGDAAKTHQIKISHGCPVCSTEILSNHAVEFHRNANLAENFFTELKDGGTELDESTKVGTRKRPKDSIDLQFEASKCFEQLPVRTIV